MSVNLHLLVTLRGVPAGDERAIASAVDALLAKEGLQLIGPLAPPKTPDMLAWCSPPAAPVIISGPHRWLPAFTRAVEVTAKKASAGKVRSSVEALDADEIAAARGPLPTALRTMKQLAKQKQKPKPQPESAPAARVTDAKAEIATWRALEATFGKLTAVKAHARRGLAVGRGRLRIEGKPRDVFVTCGLTLMGHGAELYAMAAERSDAPFAGELLAAVAHDTADSTPSPAIDLRDPPRFTVELGKIRGKSVLAFIDPDTADLPREAKRGAHSVALLPITSMTTTLARKKTGDGIELANVDEPGAFYPHYLRVRDPSQPDASRLATSDAASTGGAPGTSPSPAAPRRRAKGEMRRFEYIGGGSRKFWSIGHDGRFVVVSFGRIGTSGQSKSTKHSSPKAAAAAVEKLVAEKVAKGYREV